MNQQASVNDGTTPRPVREGVQAGASTVILLTVLSHPDPRRVRERAALSALDPGQRGELGRHAPRFAPLGSAWTERLPVEVLAKAEGRVADAAELLSVSRRALGRRLTDLGLRPEDPEGEGSR